MYHRTHKKLYSYLKSKDKKGSTTGNCIWPDNILNAYINDYAVFTSLKNY